MSDEEEEVVDPMAQALADLPKIYLRKSELRDDLYQKLLLLTVDAMKKNKLQKDIAQCIKQSLDADGEFNELIGKGPWQVVVGRSFASAITHEAMHLAFFDIPKWQDGKFSICKETILVYKALAVQSL